MSNVIVTELTVDARGAEHGTAQYDRAMKVAQAAIDRFLDRDNAMRAAVESNALTIANAGTTVVGAAKSWERLRAAADPTVPMMNKIRQATLDADAAVRRGITTQAEADRVLAQYAARMQSTSVAAREQAREAQALAAAQERATQEATRHAAALDDMRAAHDPVYAATRRLSQEIDQLATLESAGIEIAGGYAAAFDRIVQKHDQAARAARELAAAEEKAAREAERHAAAIDDLRAAHDPAHASARRLAQEIDQLATLEREGVEIAGGYAAAFDRIVLKYDETAQAAQRLKAAQDDLIRQAREDQAAANAKDTASANQAKFNTVLGVRTGTTNSARDSATAWEDEARAVKELREQINPLGVAYDRLMEKIKTYEAMALRGSISTDDLSKATRHAQKEYDDFAKKLPEVEGQAKLTANQVQNLGYQVNDAFTMLMSGSSVFQVFATQSGQVAQALDGPNGVSGSFEAIKQAASNAFTSVTATLGPAGLIVLGLTAAAAAATLFGTRAEDRMERVNKAAEAFGKTLADIRRSNAELGDSVEKVADRYAALSGADLRKKMLGDIDAQRRAVEEARQGAAQASLSTGGWNPLSGFRDAANAVSGNASTVMLAGMVDGFLRGSKSAKELRTELLELKAAGDVPGYLREPIQQIEEFVEKAINAEGEIKGLQQGLRNLRMEASQLRLDQASAALAGFLPDVSEVEQVERAYREAMQRIAQLEGPDKLLNRDELREAERRRRDRALEELARPSREALQEAQNRRNNLGLNPDQRSLAEIRQRYDAEIAGLERVNGAEAAIAAKREERDAAISARQIEIDRAENARREGYDLDLRAVEARTAAEKAQIAAERERVAYLQQGYSESEAAAAGERARVLSMAQATEQHSEAIRQQTDATSRQVAQAQLEYDLVGKSAGEVARLRAEFDLLAQAKDAARSAGFDESTVTLTESMRAQAAEIGRLTEATQRLNLARDQSEQLRQLEAEAGLVGLGEDARRTALAGLEAEAELRREGIPLNEAWGQSYVANARQIATMEIALDKQQEAFDGLKDASSAFFEALGSGSGILDALGSAFARFGQQLASKGFDQIFGALFGGGQGTSRVGDIGSAVSRVLSPASTSPAPQPVPPSPSYPHSEKYVVPALKSATTGLEAAAKAIRTIESGSAGGNYSAMGPVTRNGDRAYGAYQVMGNNIADWSRSAIGREVSKMEFLRSVELQDKIFEHRFGGYMAKYGAEGASRAWFAGEGGMKNWSAKDVVGTSVSGYGSRFGQLFSQHGGDSGYRSTSSIDERRAIRAYADATEKAVERGIGGALPSSVPTPTARPSALNRLFSTQLAAPGSFLGIEHGGLTIGGALGTAAGAFGGGYSSGSPVSGALSGALAGVGGGPIGMAVGALAGALGGGLGGRAQRKEAHKQAAAQWEQMRPAYEAFDRSLSGDKQGDLRAYITNGWGQLSSFMQTGGAAWKMGSGNSTAQFNSTGKKLFEGFLDMLNEFQDGFDAMITDMMSGQGLQGSFAKGRNATKDLASQIKKTRDDIDIAFGNVASIDFLNTPDAQRQAEETAARRAEAAERFNKAAAEYALSLLYTADVVSDVQKTIDGLRGTAAGLVPIFEDLGWNAEDAARAIDARLNQAIAKIARGLEQNVSDRIAELSGKGYTTSVRDFLTDFEQLKKDFAAAGADSSRLPELLRLELQAIVDGAELTGAAFSDLVKLFPALEGVVKEFSATATQTAKEIAQANLDTARAALDRSYQAEVDRINELLAARREEASELESTVSRLKDFADGIADFRKSLLVDDSLSTLTPEKRLEEARKQFLDLASKARAGDEDAQSKLTGAGQEYLTEARNFYASSERYHDAFDEVRRILDQSETAARSQLSTAESQLAALKQQISQNEALLETNRKQYEAILGTNEGVKSLEVAFREYAAAAAAARQQGIAVPGNGGGGGGGSSGPGGSGDGTGRNNGWTAASASSYLKQNPDVAKAIASGNTFGLPPGMSPEVYASAHYGLFGNGEGRGWATGGYTGPGGVNEVAGTVHRGEVVWSQRDVSAWGGPSKVEAMRTMRLPAVAMPAPPRLGSSNDNRALVVELQTANAALRALAKASAAGSLAVKSSVDQGNRVSERQGAVAKRKAMAA